MTVGVHAVMCWNVADQRRDVLECCGSSSNVFDYVLSEKKTAKCSYFTAKINYVVGKSQLREIQKIQNTPIVYLRQDCKI